MKSLLKIKIAVLLLMLSALSVTVEAASKKPLNYGPYPKPDNGYVTDLGNLLSPEEEERIEVWLWQVESRSGVEMAVVTIDSMRDYPAAANGSIEQFATGLFNAYGIGNMPKNDGVLLVVSVRERKARIELGDHYGHNYDAKAHRIMQKNILPRFRKGDFSGGIQSGTKALILEFASLRVGFPWEIVIMISMGLMLSGLAISLIRNGKQGWGWILLGLAIVIILVALRMAYVIYSHMPESSSGSWSSGGFGGGFGGGFSGGGGASGGW